MCYHERDCRPLFLRKHQNLCPKLAQTFAVVERDQPRDKKAVEDRE
jgi:hypothetical protein